MQGGQAVTQKDFAPLKTAMASIEPSSTPASQYNPTNVPAACPPVATNWEVNGDFLPPTPDKNLCDCMFNSLACQPASTLDVKSYGDIFNFICGDNPKNCAGISADTATGVYGAYSMCGAKEKLGHVLDVYYRGQNNAAGACDFKGQARINKSPSVAESCKASLASASAVNSHAATATAPAGGSQSSNFASGPVPMKNMFTLGDLAVGAYAVVAMAVGAGMVLL